MRKHRAPRLPRVPFGRTVAVVPDDDSGEAFELKSANLSLGGMFVQAEGALPEGTRVTLALAVENRYLDFAEGEVAWNHARGGFGVRFTHLPPKALALVEHLVARGGTSQFMKLDPEDVEPPRRILRPVLLAATGAAVVCAAFFALHRAPKKAPHVEERVAVMSVAPEPELKIEHKIDPAAHVFPGEFQVALPTGAVTTLRITVSDDEVTVTPALKKGASLLRVFSLPHPARLVIDVAGREPRYSWQLDGASVVKSVRVGARNHGTRVVVDLPELANPRASYRVITPPAAPFI